MSDRRTLTSSLSARVVAYLVQQSHTQARIARMLGVSEGYISLVKSRERSLTLDHIERLADWLDVPLGALFLAIVPTPKHVSPEKKKLFEASEQFLRKSDEMREAMLHRFEPKRRKSRVRGGKKPVARAR